MRTACRVASNRSPVLEGGGANPIWLGGTSILSWGTPLDKTWDRILDRTSDRTRGTPPQTGPGTSLWTGIPPPPPPSGKDQYAGVPLPLWTDRHLWKHYLPASFGMRVATTTIDPPLPSDIHASLWCNHTGLLRNGTGTEKNWVVWYYAERFTLPRD